MTPSVPSRRSRTCCAGVALLFVALAAWVHAADPAKVLRLATSDIDTLDPQQWQDIYSSVVGAQIFEAMYLWDYFALPPRPVANTAAAAPTISADGRTWTFKLRPQIYFTDDAAFGGTPRELVAADYVYSIKRYLDPNLRSAGEPLIADLLVGMRAVVDAARKPGAKLDYDIPVDGLRAIDRHTLQLQLVTPNYPAVEDLMTRMRAVAREVVTAAGGDIQARPVGTGPFRLVEWRRGSRVVLEANTRYRAITYPQSAKPAYAELIRSMQGKRLPQLGRIEFNVIDEQQTRLLEFDRGKLDIVELRGEGAQRFLLNGELDPAMAARGIRREPYETISVRSLYINMDDPVLGGMGTATVALRRAIALGIDAASLIRVVYAGQGVTSNQMLAPPLSGFDPAMAPRRYDPALANSLLDRTGYQRRDAQGFRLAPDGKKLTLQFLIFPGTVWREVQTLVKKNMDAIGVRMDFRTVQTQDLFKEVAQSHFQITIHGRSTSPTGLGFAQLYGPEPPQSNESRFKFDPYDRAFERFLRVPTDRERMESARVMNDIVAMYAPMIPLMVDIENAFSQPWVLGYHRSPFGTYFQYLDIDSARRKAAGG
ncbi:MAG: ABC transporter substrate-binding protein [Betaproteobacteria bacterium]